MSEPYNDEEIEGVKEWLNNAPPDSNRRWMNGEWIVYGRLIATIELQKSDKALGADLVRKIQGLKEENAFLKENEIDCHAEVVVLAKENAKLKADIKTLQLSSESLLKHGIKLKEEVENWKDAVKDYGVALKLEEKENAKLKEDNRLVGKIAKSNVKTTRHQLDVNSELIEENAKLKQRLNQRRLPDDIMDGVGP